MSMNGSILLGYSATVKKLFEIRKLVKPLVLDNERLKELVQIFATEMDQGLIEPTPGGLRMIPTFVRALPDNSEIGDYLALDLGGTNFRVLLVSLNKKEADMKSTIYRIPQELMVADGKELFDHIASCVAEFIKENKLKDRETLPLGFTFSFPCSQDSLMSGTLITWTKGFKCPGVVGNNVVRLLQEAIERRGDIKNVELCALLNDTTGTLMSCAHMEPNCTIGVIVETDSNGTNSFAIAFNDRCITDVDRGTGTNACYLEKLSNIPKLPEQPEGPNAMIINTEWCGLGENGCIDHFRTVFDVQVDSQTINPGQQYLEKMVSGMYLGELVRVILLALVEEGALFGKDVADTLSQQWCFPTKYISEIEKDLLEEDQNFYNTRNILLELGVEGFSGRDMSITAYICTVVSTRAAHLTAAGIAALANRINRPEIAVGIDGSVYKFHPTFKEILDEKLAELMNPGITANTMLSEDGSGRGAALVAAVAHRLNQEKVKERRERFQKQMRSQETFGLGASMSNG